MQMRVSENVLKWAMRFYPQLFFERIWVRKFHRDFNAVDVKVNASFLNRNYNASIFGGTIFSATDPFYPILLDQILQRKGYKILVWLKSAEIDYLKPARNNLFFTIKVEESDVTKAIKHLETEGKHIASVNIDVYDSDEILCAKVRNEIYIRNLNFRKYIS